jgi:hypothetical protein
MFFLPQNKEKRPQTLEKAPKNVSGEILSSFVFYDGKK